MKKYNFLQENLLILYTNLIAESGGARLVRQNANQTKVLQCLSEEDGGCYGHMLRRYSSSFYRIVLYMFISKKGNANHCNTAM